MATSTTRGDDYAVFAVSTSGAAKARPGYLQKIVVNGALTGTVTVHDNPSAASGDVLYASAAGPAAGTVIDLGIKAKRGIFVTVGAGTGPVLVSFD